MIPSSMMGITDILDGDGDITTTLSIAFTIEIIGDIMDTDIPITTTVPIILTVPTLATQEATEARFLHEEALALSQL